MKNDKYVKAIAIISWQTQQGSWDTGGLHWIQEDCSRDKMYPQQCNSTFSDQNQPDLLR